MINSHSPRQNHLLNALSTDEYNHFFPYLDLVPMPFGKILYESGSNLHYSYFPTTCMVSMLYVMKNGSSAEIVGVGNNGLIDANLFMNEGTLPIRSVVRSPGYAYRMERHQQDLDCPIGCRYETLNYLLRFYTQVLITQMAQMVICNRHHSVEQQLCRWLLISLDHLPSNELTITHELIANILGVRRESVTEAAGKLQRAGLIVCSRGRITVLNRRGLDARACECYQLVKTESDRLLLCSSRSLRRDHDGRGSLDNPMIRARIDRVATAHQ